MSVSDGDKKEREREMWLVARGCQLKPTNFLFLSGR